jgi:hypothetical protein
LAGSTGGGTDRVIGATIYVARLKEELADGPPGIFEPEVVTNYAVTLSP